MTHTNPPDLLTWPKSPSTRVRSRSISVLDWQRERKPRLLEEYFTSASNPCWPDRSDSIPQPDYHFHCTKGKGRDNPAAATRMTSRQGKDEQGRGRDETGHAAHAVTSNGRQRVAQGRVAIRPNRTSGLVGLLTPGYTNAELPGRRRSARRPYGNGHPARLQDWLDIAVPDVGARPGSHSPSSAPPAQDAA